MSNTQESYLIAQRLAEWGRWCHQVATMGLGYQHKTLLARVEEEQGTVIQSTATYIAPRNERAEEVNELIELLAETEDKGGIGKREWAEVIRIHYTMFQNDYKTKLNVSGLSRQTYYRYLNEGQSWLLRRLA